MSTLKDFLRRSGDIKLTVTPISSSPSVYPSGAGLVPLNLGDAVRGADVETVQEAIEELHQSKLEYFVDDGTGSVQPFYTSDGKINTKLLPSAILGSMSFGGTFDPTGTALVNGEKVEDGNAAFEKGEYFLVQFTAGAPPTFNDDASFDYDFAQSPATRVLPLGNGDWVVYDGNEWQVVDNTDKVLGFQPSTSVLSAGGIRIGTIQAAYGDYAYDDIQVNSFGPDATFAGPTSTLKTLLESLDGQWVSYDDTSTDLDAQLKVPTGGAPATVQDAIVSIDTRWKQWIGDLNSKTPLVYAIGGTPSNGSTIGANAPLHDFPQVVYVDTRGIPNPYNLNLPPSTSIGVGFRVQVVDSGGTAITNPVKVSPAAGDTLMGHQPSPISGPIDLDVDFFNVVFTYVGGTVGWQIET